MLFITFFHFIETAQWRALPSASLFGALLDRTAIGQKNYIWNSKDPPAFIRNIHFFNIRMETYSSTLSVAHGPKRINFLKKLFLDFLKFFVKIKSQFEADRNLNPHEEPKNWKKKEKLWSRENGDAQDVRYSGDRKRSAVNVKKKFSKPKKKNTETKSWIFERSDKYTAKTGNVLQRESIAFPRVLHHMGVAAMAASHL